MLYSCDGCYFIIWLHITYKKWQNSSWDEPEPTSILNVIYVHGWGSHTWDIDHKSYTWEISQPVMKHGISSVQGCSTSVTMR